MGFFWGYVIVGVICGLITKSMNEGKGYDGGFAWGFFLAIIGIIVVAVRPYAKTTSHTNGYGSTSGLSGGTYSTSYETADPLKAPTNKIAYCLKCKEVFVDENYGQCPKCGQYTTVKTNISERDWDKMTDTKKYELKAGWFNFGTKDDFSAEFKKKISGTEFEKYLPLLEKNNLIDPTLVFSLTSDELKEIGIEALGDRKKFLAFLSSYTIDTQKEIEEESETTQLPEPKPRDD